MARINTALSADDLSRLIDGLEGTAHLDEDEMDQAHTEQLMARLLCLFDQAMKQERQPEETGFSATVREIADLVFD